MFIQTEATPNPATLKFLPGRTVLAQRHARHARHGRRPRNRRSPSGCSRSTASSGVFFGSDFITVTKADGEWQQLKPAILGAIMEHFMSGAPLLRDETGAAADDGGRVLRGEGRRDGRHHQGTDRDAGAPGGRQ